MIELDKYDSNFVYLAKGWGKKEKEDSDYIQCVRNIWSNRCGCEEQFVRNGTIAGYLLELIAYVDKNATLLNVISSLYPYSDLFKKQNYTDNDSFDEHVIWTALYRYMSVWQIKREGEILIELQPFNPDLLFKGITYDNE